MTCSGERLDWPIPDRSTKSRTRSDSVSEEICLLRIAHTFLDCALVPLVPIRVPHAHRWLTKRSVILLFPFLLRVFVTPVVSHTYHDLGIESGCLLDPGMPRSVALHPDWIVLFLL